MLRLCDIIFIRVIFFHGGTHACWFTSAQLICDAVSNRGFRWREIATLLPHRSDDAIRNRWRRLQLGSGLTEEDGGSLGMTEQSYGPVHSSAPAFTMVRLPNT